METNQFQQEIAIIKEMVEKTRKEAAGSGTFFILIGILSIINTLILMYLGIYKNGKYALPVIIVFTIVVVLTGVFMSRNQEKKMKVKTYAKKIFGHLGLSCAIPTLLVMFVFPFTKVFSFSLVPVFCSLIVGILLFTAGAIFEVRFVQICSLSWWIGAAIIPYVPAIYSGFIMILMLLIGMILPGYLFNRKYKKPEMRK